MRHFRACKIIATLGPATDDLVAVRTLFEAGADAFRLNFSHGGHEEHRARLEHIRQLEAEAGRPIAVILDLQGPKLRLGCFSGANAELIAGDEFKLDCDDSLGDRYRAPLPHHEVFASLKPGVDILIDDGRIRLRVKECGSDHATTTVLTGGVVSDRKGIHLPGLVRTIPPLTEKDRKDLVFGLDLGCDWVALSFVQSPEDVVAARKLVAGRARLMAKLEKPAAIDHLDAIIDQADAVMVARGDLGVEVAPEAVPGLQKAIVRASRQAGKPVVVATQMLDSMVRAPQPTRAEASDVATAVYDGVDAVMLSNETAIGVHPTEAVKIMERIIIQAECDPLYRPIMESAPQRPKRTTADAITAAARQIAETVDAAVIVTFTDSGSTTLRAARERPTVPIICLTPSLSTARQMTLAWGVHSIKFTDEVSENFRDMVGRATEFAHQDGLAMPGERVVVTAGVPYGTPGTTNILRVAKVKN